MTHYILDLRVAHALGLDAPPVKVAIRAKESTPENEEKLRALAIFNPEPLHTSPTYIAWKAWTAGFRETVLCGVVCVLSDASSEEAITARKTFPDITEGLPFMEERARLAARLREIDAAQADEIDRRIAALQDEHECEDVAGQPDGKF